MENFLSEHVFNELFMGKDFAFLMKKIGNDYQYIRLNQAAQTLLTNEAVGKMLSTVTSERTFTLVRANYDLAIATQQQVDYMDYVFIQSEQRKYETTVRPLRHQEEDYILAITKEIRYERKIEDKFLFMRSVFDRSFISTAILSQEGTIYEVNARFVEDFGLHAEDVKSQPFSKLPIITEQEAAKMDTYIQNVVAGKVIGQKIIRLRTLDQQERVYLISFSSFTYDADSLAIFLVMQDLTMFTEQEVELRSKTHHLEVFKAALNFATAIAILDVDGNIEEINELFLNALGYTADEIIGQPYHLIDPRTSEQSVTTMIASIKDGKVWRGELCFRTKYLVDYWVEAVIIPLKDEQGQITQYLSINYDITDKKRMFIELKNTERTFRLITENTNDLIVITDEDGIIMYASPSYQLYLGYRNVELQGHFYSNILADESKAVWQAFLTDYKDQHDTQLELLLKAKDGSTRWSEGNITIVNDPKREKVSQIMMLSREITHRKEWENDLLYLAYHDTLTQLPNRRYLAKEFPVILDKMTSNQHSLALFFIDGDDFKDVNDNYGHDMGDEFIRKFGQVLITSIRSHDLVIRIGGDEFVVVLTGLAGDQEKRHVQTMHIIERIREGLRRGWTIEGHDFAPTASMGIAYYPEHGHTLDQLLERADQALYKAKEQGKDHLCIAE
ncbi:diguanylate cyclase domain-containing protein [Lysinibacillus piscis]|uniref:Diguanylate cyclase n=1 Tax=Lysinibacillus piscis TaxID=2518931 RepID=A0ABQ5NM15_9BACI|nr:diguanylate cyclase [Lysinibacillus sp. KH24]GLC89136.1 hypothetical protein LYSBPC_22630 [Lysinibacillus sp. KH24]